MRISALCRLLAATVLLFTAAQPASAKSLARSFQSTRALGMGGAYTAVADDASALFLNAAGLDRLKDWSFSALNPAVETNTDTVDFYRDAKDIDRENSAEVADLLRDAIDMGDILHARATIYPHFVMHHLGVALVGNAVADVTPHNVAYPEADISASGYAGVQLGVGLPLVEDSLSFGGAVKFLRGWTLQETYDVAAIADQDFEDRIEDDVSRGTGFGLDVGMLYSLPGLPFSASLGVTALNIFDTDMGDGGELPMQINAGLALSKNFDDWFTLTLAADYLDITGNLDDDGDDYDAVKRLHAGIEAWLTKRLGLRAGVYQGNATFGATLDLWVLKAEWATYAEELGMYAGSKEDRRHVVQVSLGW